MKKYQNMDELFRDKLANFEQAPPAYILDNVLDGVAGARRKRKNIFWRIAGIAAALLLAFIAGWQINGRKVQLVNPSEIVYQQKAPESSSAVQQVTHANVSTKPSAAMPVQPGNDSKTNNSQIAAISFENHSNLISKRAVKTDSEQGEITFGKLNTHDPEESALLLPVKSLIRLLNQSTPFIASNLYKLDPIIRQTNNSEKTIDQQIMEQNRQEMLAMNQSKTKNRWLIGAQVSPEYNVSRSSHSQVYASNMLNASSNPVDLGGGISVEFKKGKRWSLQSGVYYSGMGQTSGNSYTSSGKDYALASSDRGSEYFNTNVSFDASNSKMMMNSTAGVIEFKGIPSGIVLGTNLEDKTQALNAVVVSDARFIQNFEYIEIPLYLRYTLIDSKFDVEMLGGFSSNVLVGNQTFMESSAGRSEIGTTKDMESLSYSGTLGVGLKYGLSRRIYLNVEPRIKYFLNSLNSNSSVNYKPYTVGIFTGLSYEF
jgi:hypothetical protein